MDEPRRTYRVAHISDIHFGHIAQPRIVENLIDEVNACGVDLVAVSGDLTQRARPQQYEAAVRMLDAFTSPVLVVPGNHDVYPWWRPALRILRPLRRYRHYISEDLHPTFVRRGLAVLGINSAHGRTVKGGRIGTAELDAIDAFFGGQDAHAFKILVVHHHLTKLQALGPHDVARRARRALEAASHVGVDLILCGHLHVSHIEPLELVPETHPVVIASAGTATSSRGRGIHRETNYYNLIDVASGHFVIDERRYDPVNACFVSENTVRFERRAERT